MNSLVNFPYTQRLSWRKKKANDFAWAEEMSDYYDYYYGADHLSDLQDKYRMNYDLYNGRGGKALESWAATMSNERLLEMGIDTGYKNIQHHDIISQIAKAMVGEQRQRPLRITAVDTSHYAMNMRKYERQRLMSEYLNEKYVLPIKQQAAAQYMMENQIKDPYSLSPEQQQQMQADVERRSQAMTPKEIIEYMRKDYKTPSEKQAQQLLEYLKRNLNIKWKTDEGFKHAVITGREIYRIGVRHNEVYLDQVNPSGFTYSAKANTTWIEEADWAKYEEKIKYSDIFNEFGDQMTRKHFDKIDRLFHGMDSTYHRNEHESRLVRIMSRLPEGVMEQVDPRTNEGQDWLKEFYRKNGAYAAAQADIRKVHVVWRSLRKLKYITRLEQDAKTSFWVDESYRFNELKGDIEEKIVWVPEVWETTKIGTIDALYFNKRPVPYQYKSIHNPWDVKLPYYGAEYSRLMGNSENVSPIDLGKPWQFKFNVQMARLQEMEQTDLGKVLLTTTGAIPAEWDPGTFFEMLKYGKMAQLDLSQEGVSAYDAQFFKSIDLSNSDKIAGQVSYMQWIQQMVANAMSYNASRLGQISPYIPVTNNQQNIVQSSFQTEDLYSMHSKIVENLMNGLIDAARVAYRNNPIRQAFVLDDLTTAELVLDKEMMNRSEIAVFMSNDHNDYMRIEKIKQNAQHMIQNGLITFSELVKLEFAGSGSEIINMAEQAELKRMQMQQQQQAQQQQTQMQMMQQQLEMEAKMKEMDAMLKKMLQDNEYAHKKDITMIGVTEQARAFDINENKKSDLVEGREIDAESRERIKEKELEFKEKELASKEKIEMKKIEASKKSPKPA